MSRSVRREKGRVDGRGLWAYVHGMNRSKCCGLLLAGVVGVFVWGGLWGCAWKGDVSEFGGVGGGVGGDGVWRLEPVELRVYPSTRFVRSEGGPVLDARIELLDEMGDSVKGVGRFRLELWADDAEARRHGKREGRQKLYGWNVPMLTLGDQELHYDSITRAYLFRLRLDDYGSGRRDTELEVVFTPLGGRRLSTRSRLPFGEGGE